MADLRAVPIDGFETLARVMRDFHDERFDLDAMKYEPENHRWLGRFFRRVHDPNRTTREHKAGGVTRCHFPVVEGTLSLHNVTDCRVLDDQGIVTYSFVQCERTSAGCALVFCEALTIQIDVSGVLWGELRERELDRRGYVDEHSPFVTGGLRLEGEN